MLTIFDATYTKDHTYMSDSKAGMYFIDDKKVSKEEFEKATEFLKHSTPIGQ